MLAAPPLPSGNGQVSVGLLCPHVPHEAGGQGAPSRKSHSLSLCCGVNILYAGLALPLLEEGRGSLGIAAPWQLYSGLYLFYILMPSVHQSCEKGLMGISESPGSWQCFISDLVVEGRAGDTFNSFLSPSMLSHHALCPFPQQGPSSSWLCSCSPPGLPSTHPLLLSLCCPSTDGPA